MAAAMQYTAPPPPAHRQLANRWGQPPLTPGASQHMALQHWESPVRHSVNEQPAHSPIYAKYSTFPYTQHLQLRDVIGQQNARRQVIGNRSGDVLHSNEQVAANRAQHSVMTSTSSKDPQDAYAMQFQRQQSLLPRVGTSLASPVQQDRKRSRKTRGHQATDPQEYV
ncbi:PREDICTED: uncharacterized protein LOC106810121 [Priapulus caudatus]|uniref:Uncharacterized protein LOC106810121 n=1 Tax=Priapulus caudatus TaxID=37621 RepID=A0ABM1E9L1_PRICU|nr:PREDICTED: uncharacterized protein LOC106810121 [Priapulus caudatus]